MARNRHGPNSWGPLDSRGYAHTRTGRGGSAVRVCPFEEGALPDIPEKDDVEGARAVIRQLVDAEYSRLAWPRALQNRYYADNRAALRKKAKEAKEKAKEAAELPALDI